MALRTIRVQGDSVLTKKSPASRENDTEDRGTRSQICWIPCMMQWVLALLHHR